MMGHRVRRARIPAGPGRPVPGQRPRIVPAR
jgi:hypothetical protein